MKGIGDFFQGYIIGSLSLFILGVLAVWLINCTTDGQSAYDSVITADGASYVSITNDIAVPDVADFTEFVTLDVDYSSDVMTGWADSNPPLLQVDVQGRLICSQDTLLELERGGVLYDIFIRREGGVSHSETQKPIIGYPSIGGYVE